MKHFGATLALALVLAAPDAQAATFTANLRVQATISNGCIVTGNTLDFGQSSLALLRLSQRPQTNINVNCTIGASFQVGIGNGANPSGGQRRMKRDDGTEFLAYELYKSLTGSDRFGDFLPSERVSGTGTGTTPVVVPVYGSLSGTDEAPAGNYVDNAVITVYF